VPHQGAVPVTAADANSVEQVEAKHKNIRYQLFSRSSRTVQQARNEKNKHDLQDE